jgi:transposase-like protein
MASKGQKFKKIQVELKEEILKKYFEGFSSYELAKEYSISENTIRMWSYNLRHSKVGGKKGRPKTKELTKEDYKERYEILKKYQAFLEARRGKK